MKYEYCYISWRTLYVQIQQAIYTIIIIIGSKCFAK